MTPDHMPLIIFAVLFSVLAISFGFSAGEWYRKWDSDLMRAERERNDNIAREAAVLVRTEGLTVKEALDKAERTYKENLK